MGVLKAAALALTAVNGLVATLHEAALAGGGGSISGGSGTSTGTSTTSSSYYVSHGHGHTSSNGTAPPPPHPPPQNHDGPGGAATKVGQEFLVALTVCYCILLLVVLFQISRICFYRHRLMSFQCGFLMLTSVWMVLRVWFTVSQVIAPAKPYMPQWATNIIYWLPINLEFAVFSLLILFYVQTIHKNTDKNEWERRWRLPYFLAYGVINFVLLVLAAVWEIVTLKPHNPKVLLTIRLAITAIVNVILVLFLAYYAFRLYRLLLYSKVKMPFGATISSSRQIMWVTNIILFLFVTRSVYDTATVTGLWRVNLSSKNAALPSELFFTFFFLWEVVPTGLVLFIFRRIPRTNSRRVGRQPFRNSMSRTADYQSIINSSTGIKTSAAARAPFFDDPNRYDSDDETTGVSPISPAVFVNPAFYPVGGSYGATPPNYQSGVRR